MDSIGPRTRSARRGADHIPVRVSKRARTRKLRIWRVGPAIEIDAEHIVLSSDYVTIGCTRSWHVVVLPTRTQDLPSVDCFTFFHSNSVCVNPCAGVDEVWFVYVSTSSVMAVTNRF
jgi:hypothetical protein